MRRRRAETPHVTLIVDLRANRLFSDSHILFYIVSSCPLVLLTTTETEKRTNRRGNNNWVSFILQLRDPFIVALVSGL